ncbi:MAG: hypothetical protein ACRDOU_05365 [Streptosporangiaceae bacterium]
MVHVHGTPGQSLREDGIRAYGRVAIRASFIEEATARALEKWLTDRPDSAGLHLFHDLGGFRSVAGHGFGPVSLGTANIDHVVLSGAGWLVIDTVALPARPSRPESADPPAAPMSLAEEYRSWG